MIDANIHNPILPMLSEVWKFQFKEFPNNFFSV